MKRLVFILCTFVLLGSGCTSSQVSEASLKAAQSLLLENQSTIYLTQTVFGVDPVDVPIVGDTSITYRMHLHNWQPNSVVSFDWTRESAPIGVPTENGGVTDDTIPHRETGLLSSTSLDHGTTLLLPSLWGVVPSDQQTLLWLSSDQYQSLKETGETTLDLGMFDNSIATLFGVSHILDRVSAWTGTQIPGFGGVEQSVRVHTEDKPGAFTLQVNGEETTVQTIELNNWFGRYTVLDNAENPLILEAVLSPAAKGSLKLLAEKRFQEAFEGYRVTEIVTE